MRYLIIALIILSVFKFYPKNFGAVSEDKINQEIVKLETILNSDKQASGKYKRKDKTIIDNVEYEVHEYETSLGEIGYTIFITKEEDGKIYNKAISTGVEKMNREYDWRLIKDNTLRATST